MHDLLSSEPLKLWGLSLFPRYFWYGPMMLDKGRFSTLILAFPPTRLCIYQEHRSVGVHLELIDISSVSALFKRLADACENFNLSVSPYKAF